jgi:predicted ATPase
VLTKLTIRNFKRFAAAEIELGNPVVFIGPNNSGKTTALQAIALWEVGLRRSTINRKDLVAVPAPMPNCRGRMCT